MAKTARMDTPDKTNSSLLMISGTAVALLMFVWAYSSGQQLLQRQAPLIDTVMQIRVDLSHTHELLHESNESAHAATDNIALIKAVGNITAEVNALHHGNVHMGDMSELISATPQSTASVQALNKSVEKLAAYVEGNYTHLTQDSDKDLLHDLYFFNAEALAAQYDNQIHLNTEQAIERQTMIFAVLLLIAILIITTLFYLLRRSERNRAITMDKTAWLSQALEHSGEGVIIANADGVIEFVNHAFCQMTGYSVEETLGNNPSMLNSGKQNKPFYEHLWQTITSGNAWRGELTNKRKDGSLYPALMTIAPIMNHQGVLTHYIANQRDISEHKALEEHVFEAQKLEAIGALAGGIAHDFNNALTGIVGNLYLLNKSPEDQDKVVQRTASIQHICDSAAIHIKQILSYARNDSVLMDSVELNQCVRNACQMASAMMIPATIELEFISYQQQLYVHWNETQVQQILINLINNARHALIGVESPNITLEIKIVDNDESIMRFNQAMTDEKYICLLVKDNGCGMSGEVMRKIFDPFFTTKQPDQGTGLGLSMAYGAIKQAGGDLIVASEPGHGTVFQILIPIGFETQLELETEPGQINTGHGETILIADDDKERVSAGAERDD
ncbi:MAG: hypothetical protein COW18_11560 [Zetaproteobacteria bacterium CG12_big_fil_rev_8_21_14_0_65_54_13]|nr:MAG: hypothetical protein COW18_11560 [Zetaproteobacteria bacterium CG12_big_fil_rev_8_21_14_0_65_54_13]PIX55423.1 MAG: hypothetical protein COZ50_02825 [Zetaproteobacteria bacterium CG_4_10_14_3_um_filter_54_28]PJA27489.1 MAG: hypothetical protein CO188_12265 [Zetaproteobacteria bacterium CG_4_9_14_3_um_filter_54_145]